MSSRGMWLLLFMAGVGAILGHLLGQQVAPGMARTAVFAVVVIVVMLAAGRLGERLGLIKGSPRERQSAAQGASRLTPEKLTNVENAAETGIPVSEAKTAAQVQSSLSAVTTVSQDATRGEIK